jgi:methylmalonyl-CoA carboxyltransferase small subunit
VKLKIVIAGKTYEVDVDVADESSLDPSTPVTAIIQSTVLPTAGKITVSGADNGKLVRSPLAGLVARVHVTPGQQVQADDLLMVLEAMKMETNITAQTAGKIQSVNVAPGAAVKIDQVLLRFE